ncbi:MAG TPA: HAMP domain-containing sensor histidine kinase [Capillimicrobium sp.]|nr:HAMP domain-containing sensor histidine kinase [Capillimicrobium sp.]
MTIAAVTGWLAAFAALAAAGWAWARLRSRMELVARAAHELRSPLCAARLAVHAAAREGGWPALAPVDRELARAGLALDDLGAARSGARAGDRVERVDVGDLLREVRETWAPLAWPVRREVRVEPSSQTLVVRVDRLRATQALGNLVGNALEHGSGPVVLRARGAGERVRLEVEDRGAGLPAPLPVLTRRPRGGRGARGRGLAIAAEIARRHGGALHDERTTGGCRLVLELPAADAPVVAHREARSAAAADVDLLAALRWGGTARPRPRTRRRPPARVRT